MTVYPGWYQGRATLIHFKIRSDPGAAPGLEFTSQLFFDDTLSDQVYAAEPYVSKTGSRLRNDGDGIYGQSDGPTLLDVSESGAGYAGTFEIGVQV